MPHSISVLAIQNAARGGEILAALTERLDVSTTHPDSAGVVQLWLPLDGSVAHDKILAALDVTAEDWREHIEFR
jgi:hypothetical protein